MDKTKPIDESASQNVADNLHSEESEPTSARPEEPVAGGPAIDSTEAEPALALAPTVTSVPPVRVSPRRRWRWLWLAAVVVVVIGAAVSWHKATNPDVASISAPKPVAETGHRVKLPIVINTAGNTINAAQIHLTFDPKVLQVDSVGKDGTFFSLWVAGQPTFNNITGDISFAGGIFTPGFHGVGQVGSVTLVAKQAVSSRLTFTDTEVLLNDGHGTSVPLKLSPIEVNIQ